MSESPTDPRILQAPELSASDIKRERARLIAELDGKSSIGFIDGDRVDAQPTP